MFRLVDFPVYFYQSFNLWLYLYFRRKAQKCYCGAANCRGRIGEESDTEGEDNGEISDASPSMEDEELEDEEVTVEEKKLKSGRRFVKDGKRRKLRRRQRKPPRSKDFSKVTS